MIDNCAHKNPRNGAKTKTSIRKNRKFPPSTRGKLTATHWTDLLTLPVTQHLHFEQTSHSINPTDNLNSRTVAGYLRSFPSTPPSFCTCRHRHPSPMAVVKFTTPRECRGRIPQCGRNQFFSYHSCVCYAQASSQLSPSTFFLVDVVSAFGIWYVKSLSLNFDLL